MQPSRILAFVLWLSVAIAHDYSIPAQWTNTTSSLSQEERIQMAQGLLDTLSTHYDLHNGEILSLNIGQNANLASATAIHDSIVHIDANYQLVSNHISQAPIKHLPFSNDPLMWGLSAIYAYRAYQDQQFLQTAIHIWTYISQWMITLEDAQKGMHPKKVGKLSAECNDASVAGGVFYRIDTLHNMDLGVNAATEGAYMTLSAYLYSLTGNQTFLDAANLANQFMQSHLYDYNANYVMDTIELSTCQYAEPLILTYNTGLYLEGLSVLSNATGNSTILQLANQLAASAVTNTNWVSREGIIVEGSTNDATRNQNAQTFKGILTRALYEHWTRSPAASEISKLLEGFLLVQYNALLNLARFPNTDWYTPIWTGPPIPSLLPWGQLAAIDVLNSAVGLGTLDSSIPSSIDQPYSTSTTSATPLSRDHHLGAIIGGTIGGLLFLVLAGLAVFFVLRNRTRVEAPRRASKTSSLVDARVITKIDSGVSKIDNNLTYHRGLPTTGSETGYTAVSSGPYNNFQWSRALVSGRPGP